MQMRVGVHIPEHSVEPHVTVQAQNEDGGEITQLWFTAEEAVSIAGLLVRAAQTLGVSSMDEELAKQFAGLEHELRFAVEENSALRHTLPDSFPQMCMVKRLDLVQTIAALRKPKRAMLLLATESAGTSVQVMGNVQAMSANDDGHVSVVITEAFYSGPELDLKLR